jgi:hypothetical protein
VYWPQSGCSRLRHRELVARRLRRLQRGVQTTTLDGFNMYTLGGIRRFLSAAFLGLSPWGAMLERKAIRIVLTSKRKNPSYCVASITLQSRH